MAQEKKLHDSCITCSFFWFYQTLQRRMWSTSFSAEVNILKCSFTFPINPYFQKVFHFLPCFKCVVPYFFLTCPRKFSQCSGKTVFLKYIYCWKVCINTEPAVLVPLQTSWFVSVVGRQFPGGSVDGPSRCGSSGRHSEIFWGSIYESCNSPGEWNFSYFLGRLPKVDLII